MVSWLKRLTGRYEVAISAGNFKFYSPRHKYRHVPSHSLSNIPVLPAFSNVNNNSELANAVEFCTENDQLPSKHHMQGISHQHQFKPVHQTESLSSHRNQHFRNTNQCAHSSPHLPDIHHPHQSPAMSQHMTCL